MNLAFLKIWGNASSKLKSLSEKGWFYPIALLLIGLMTYGYSLGSLGYYWDDWEVVFLLHTQQLPLLYGYFAFDRPFAWPYQLMYMVFGLNVLAWHLVTLLLRWTGVLFFYLALRSVWPRFDSYLRWLGALIIVYPGFFQQSISGAYNRHFMAFALFSISLYLMVSAVRLPARGWLLWPLSWIAAALQVITIEYFVGLELARFLLLWLLLGGEAALSGARRLLKALLLFVPYLAVFATYFWWRLFVFPTTLARMNYAGDFKLLQDFGGSFFTGFMALLTRGVFDLIYSTVRVWFGSLVDPAAFTFESKAAWFALGIGVLIAVLFGFTQPLGEARGSPRQGASRRSLFAFGFLAFLVSAVPIWLTSRQISGTGSWDDRFSLAAMLGACIMVIVLIMWLVRERWQGLVLAVLLTVSVTTQALIVNRYRLEWNVENDYYWQLAWRVPALMPQTAIFSLEQPSASVPGYDTSFALNVLFDGKVIDGSVPYWFFTNNRFLNFDFVPGKSISYKDRNLRFAGSTSNAISVVHQGEDRCLQVLDSEYADQPFYGAGQAQLVAVSNVSRILANPGAVPPDPGIFGAEPPHTWCYYFEQADLARQMQDWNTVLRLDKQSRQLGLAPKFGAEYVPFIEANAQTGDWPKALELSRAAQALSVQMNPLLCDIWASMSKLPSADASIVAQARRDFSCPSP